MFRRRGGNTARMDFRKKYENQQNRPYNYRPSLLQNAPGWYNITWNNFTTGPYVQDIRMLNVRVAEFSRRNCDQRLMSKATFHVLSEFRAIDRNTSDHAIMLRL